MLTKIVSLLSLIQIWNSFAKERMLWLSLNKSTRYEVLTFVYQSQFEI